MKTWQKFCLYIFRWQLSTPILAIVLYLLAGVNLILATIIANLVGAIIFYWVDKWIFMPSYK
jgi:putative flippase GtrA